VTHSVEQQTNWKAEKVLKQRNILDIYHIMNIIINLPTGSGQDLSTESSDTLKGGLFLSRTKTTYLHPKMVATELLFSCVYIHVKTDI
jgi:hypothetical protein